MEQELSGEVKDRSGKIGHALLCTLKLWELQEPTLLEDETGGLNYKE